MSPLAAPPGLLLFGWIAAAALLALVARQQRHSPRLLLAIAATGVFLWGMVLSVWLFLAAATAGPVPPWLAATVCGWAVIEALAVVFIVRGGWSAAGRPAELGRSLALTWTLLPLTMTAVLYVRHLLVR